MVCREKLSNVEKCWVLKISDGVWSRFWLVPIGDFDITRRYAKHQEMSRNVEKCWVLSKSLLGGLLLRAQTDEAQTEEVFWNLFWEVQYRVSSFLVKWKRTALNSRRKPNVYSFPISGDNVMSSGKKLTNFIFGKWSNSLKCFQKLIFLPLWNYCVRFVWLWFCVTKKITIFYQVYYHELGSPLC